MAHAHRERRCSRSRCWRCRLPERADGRGSGGLRGAARRDRRAPSRTRRRPCRPAKAAAEGPAGAATQRRLAARGRARLRLRRDGQARSVPLVRARPPRSSAKHRRARSSSSTSRSSRCTAVVWETERPRALVTDPSGQGYVVQRGRPDRQERGRRHDASATTDARPETYVDYLGEPTTKEIEMRVRQSQGG